MLSSHLLPMPQPTAICSLSPWIYPSWIVSRNGIIKYKRPSASAFLHSEWCFLGLFTSRHGSVFYVITWTHNRQSNRCASVYLCLHQCHISYFHLLAIIRVYLEINMCCWVLVTIPLSICLEVELLVSMIIMCVIF
jgi:hypothetical protein